MSRFPVSTTPILQLRATPYIGHLPLISARNPLASGR
jgi:hypothetical protein